VNDSQQFEPTGTPDAAPSVRITFETDRDHGYVAIVDVCGEHDIATADDIAQALRGLSGNVLVDLSECKFIDSTVIGVLLDNLRVRTREGQRLDLLVPVANTRISRTLEVAGVRGLLSVYDSRP
jgi:anti-anti-sigma factor